jgi:hypothetical protein
VGPLVGELLGEDVGLLAHGGSERLRISPMGQVSRIHTLTRSYFRRRSCERGLSATQRGTHSKFMTSETFMPWAGKTAPHPERFSKDSRLGEGWQKI